MDENAKVKAMYRLFVGFRKLGEFGSILAAKRYARNNGLSGMFNLMGDNGYRDSWYVFESEATAATTGKNQHGR
ncbi:hypothetical protein FACS1894169_09550 [Bacteroidia bacterium]|nr:hypothetical protein FACS1894169_09550 [Bacteroidia bacterium]